VLFQHGHHGRGDGHAPLRMRFGRPQHPQRTESPLHDQTVVLPVDVTPEEAQSFIESESRAEQGHPEGAYCAS
jgi:hypothetical protein